MSGPQPGNSEWRWVAGYVTAVLLAMIVVCVGAWAVFR